MSPTAERQRHGALERPPTVLVVEDEIIIRLVIADYLRDFGYRVIEASDAEEALKVLDKTDEMIDIVFSDVQMPGEMDGFALAQRLRRDYPTIKVVLTSGVAKQTDAAEALCEEKNAFISKPYEAAEVERRIWLFLA